MFVVKKKRKEKENVLSHISCREQMWTVSVTQKISNPYVLWNITVIFG